MTMRALLPTSVVSTGSLNRVHKARLRIDAEVGLHPKMPHVALLGLVDVRITFARCIFGRRRGHRDDGCIHHRVTSQKQAPGS